MLTVMLTGVIAAVVHQTAQGAVQYSTVVYRAVQSTTVLEYQGEMHAVAGVPTFNIASDSSLYVSPSALVLAATTSAITLPFNISSSTSIVPASLQDSTA